MLVAASEKPAAEKLKETGWIIDARIVKRCIFVTSAKIVSFVNTPQVYLSVKDACQGIGKQCLSTMKTRNDLKLAIEKVG